VVRTDREYERIGGTRTLRMEARIVAATSRHLQAEVRSGRFRRDLYFRLAVVELHVPALRERAQDLPALIHFGVQRLALQFGVPAPPVTPGFCELLRAHTWPGNVRELFNLLERLLAEGSDRLDASRLAGFAPPLGGLLGNTECRVGCAAPPPRGPERAASGEAGDLERIASTLVETGGNVARTARRLGLPRSTLRHRIERHGLAHLIPRD
jgi:DNA-binding NtrC family response regulator